MIDLKSIDDLARRLSELVPPGLKDARADIEQNMKATLQAGLAKLDLVTREEFEVQRAVLLRTREKIDALERAVQILEARQVTPGDSRNYVQPDDSGAGAQSRPHGRSCARSAGRGLPRTGFAGAQHRRLTRGRRARKSRSRARRHPLRAV